MIHLMDYHFTWALSRTKKRLQVQSMTDTDNEDEQDKLALSECDKDLDVDVSMDKDAMEHNGEGILEASNTDFEAGNVIGKLMAFIALIHTCSEDM